MKFLKYLFFILLILIVASIIAVKVFSKAAPIGKSGTEADALASTILIKLNKSAFDTIPFLQWEFFRAGQKYFWDKKGNNAIIEWGENKVIMNLDSQMASSFTQGVKQQGSEHEKLKSKAWSNWCNDSFWMIAPFKMFDSGTTREIVNLENGDKGLLIKYESGGVTPGDQYLWEIGRDQIPTGYKMWTSIIPVQGMYASWGGWESHMGALLSTKHDLMGKEMTMKNVKAGNSWADFGYTSDPFVQN